MAIEIYCDRCHKHVMSVAPASEIISSLSYKLGMGGGWHYFCSKDCMVLSFIAQVNL